MKCIFGLKSTTESLKYYHFWGENDMEHKRTVLSLPFAENETWWAFDNTGCNEHIMKFMDWT